MLFINFYPMTSTSAASSGIRGLWPAMLTPISPDGNIDLARMVAHGQRLIAAGCDGLTLFGTTGEGTAFTAAQRIAATDALLASGVQGKQLIINLTALAQGDTVALAQHAERVGAAGGMLMPPFYYNGQHDAGLVAYVSEVIAQTSGELKIILYHFPSLSGVGFSHAAIAHLIAQHPQQIAGLKDSSATVETSKAFAQAFPSLAILVGCEPDVAPTMLVGGAGSICGLANVAPELMRRIMDAPANVSAADDQRMRNLLALLSIKPGMPFVSAYKTILAEQSGDDAWLRVKSPLTRLLPDENEAVRQAYRHLPT
jgi:4-hydroxy-tetrahydrodipicolinate synthase